jgi:hypothetical protein
MLQLAIEYIVVSFILGAVWHMVIFADYYKKLEIYSRIDNPRIPFGLSAMFLQSIVLAYIYPLINNVYTFGLGVFLTLVSFMVFAEVGKQNTTSVSGFVKIQIAYCLVQSVLVAGVFYLIPML